MRRSMCAVLVLSLCLAAPLYAHHVKKAESGTLPVTTSSPEARELYEKGMADYENLYLERCNGEWRAAVKEDPNLAVAWAWIAFNSGNPQEVSAARAKAKELAPKLTPGEQLMVAWIAKVQEGDFIGGISAMNDLLEMYPAGAPPKADKWTLDAFLKAAEACHKAGVPFGISGTTNLLRIARVPEH